ncbi:MAG TPA: aminopeptidase N, partial [Actinomycetota bacterium]|nr:aminopeptidase N [Actinomycetota bacterium]
MLTTVQDNLTREEAVARAAIISGCVYDIALDVTGGDEVFESTTTVRFDCSEPGASTFIDLTAPSVESIELNGQQVPLEAFEGHRIRLDDLQASNTLRVTATCSYRHTGTGLHHFRDPVDKEVYLHTQFEPFDAHAVYACFDQPDIKGTFAFTVTAPEGWEVVSNMAPTSAPGSGGGRWAFPPTPVMSTYITAIVAGPFHVVRDRHRNIDLGLFCRKSLAQYLDPEEIFEVTKQGFDWFEKAFDYPYPFGKYDQLFVPEFKFGAMENAGCVTFVEAYVFRSRVTDAARESRASTILHEMAHMWFGDLVTMRWWDDLWLNESFATFMGNLCMSRATRFTNVWATFASGTKTGAYRQDQLPSTHPIVADIPDIHATHLNFDAITYNKGASVLKQLVAWAGEGAFLDGLKEYFRRHEWGNTDLSDFLAPIAAKSGRDLQAWSAEWLETAGVNTLRLSIETEGSVLRSVQVLQEAPESHPHLRPHRMAIGLYDASDDGLVLRRRVELDVDGDRTAVPELDGEKVPDLLLP